MGQMVFQFNLEPQAMRAMIVPLSEGSANVGRERDEPKQMLFEQPLSTAERRILRMLPLPIV